ncbi:MAG: adenylate/guanylate cyclase domain-containing protein, partial [Bacteroidia bacterium]
FGSAVLLVLLAGGITTRLRYVRKSKNIIEKEKARSDDLLLNILPAQVAEELKTKGESEAQHFDQVSILFTDFKEFTQTAEKLSAKDLVNEINTCFKAFDNICEKYGIEKIKTIGDS